MGTISVPVSAAQAKFIKQLVKSSRAANKAHALRLGIDALVENATFASLQEAREGKVLYGNPRTLIKKF